MKLIRLAATSDLSYTALLLIALASLFLLNPQPAKAALGDQASSVINDRIKMKATAATTTAALYTIHELQTPYGTIVREYVASTGIVFAVTWQGPFQPDLKQLLGSYFDVYSTAPRSLTSTRSQATVELDNLVVHVTGHARAFIGQAYDPRLVPGGVNVGEIQ
jgi:Protein of unknown function (DUF2844)